MSKRIVDIIFSLVGIMLLSPIVLISWLLACVDTNSNGWFIQERIGQFGKPFNIFKFRTIHPKTNKISTIGAYLRKFKLDELPQLFNILKGDMSMVGPRPDVSGYYDKLEGESRKILKLKPGLTSRAAIKFSNEEDLLSRQNNPIKFNDEVIFPDKVKLNLAYYDKHTFWGDIKIILKTIWIAFNRVVLELFVIVSQTLKSNIF